MRFSTFKLLKLLRSSMVKMAWLSALLLSLARFQTSIASIRSRPHGNRVAGWNPTAFEELVQTYVSWGSMPGKEMPDCSSFDMLFTGNKTWISPFAVPDGLAIFDIQKTCKLLAQNLTWHSGALTPGNYIYPFYSGSQDVQFAGFVWTAAGSASEFETFFGRKEYDFKVLSVLEPDNSDHIYLAKDSFWPEGNGEPPETVKTLVTQYASLMGGDCKKFPSLFGTENRYVAVSGDGHRYEGTEELTAYCNMLMSSWTEYVYKIDHVSYGVGTHGNEINYVAFTWMRIGLYKGEAKTQLLLTEMGIESESPVPEIRIGGAFDYFEIKP